VKSLTVPDGAALRGGAEVHVWLVRAEHAASPEVLSPRERLAATHFRVSADRQRFVAARSALRILLGQYIGRPPQSLPIIAGAGRKPSLADGAVEFNVSHSGAWIALAFAIGHPVGIDIEERRPLPEYRDLIRHYFAPAERHHLAAHPPATALREFFRLWTRKEALLKGTGQGLLLPLELYDVLDPRPAAAPGWRVMDLEVPEGYAGAVAVRGEVGVRVCGT
jgi:4'-phosphopantetheinyl transferase